MSNAYSDPWDMLNNFCFHVYARESLFVGENGNGFFYHLLLLSTSACDIRVHGAGSQLIIVKSRDRLLQLREYENVYTSSEFFTPALM